MELTDAEQAEYDRKGQQHWQNTIGPEVRRMIDAGATDEEVDAFLEEAATMSAAADVARMGLSELSLRN